LSLMSLFQLDSPMKGEDDFLADFLNSDTDSPVSTTSERIFTLTRVGYEPLDYFMPTPQSALTYSIFTNYTTLLEPYAPMDLVVFDSSTESGYDETNKYSYVACPLEGQSTGGGCTTGTSGSLSSVFSCSAFDEYEIKVTTLDQHGDEIDGSTVTGYGLCMYVRREIRDLTESDLGKTMDSMYALWSTLQEDGEQKYGMQFKNSTYFASAHDFNAAWQDADHIHEGLGFLPQHIKITNAFEKSMQAVDRSVSLPYWDFTIDYAQNLTIFESPIFSADMFGTLVQPTDHYWGWTYKNDKIVDAAIPDGRWKQAPADVNYQYPDLQNGFGYIRGPWNMNPSPYITRFTSYTLSLPSCLDYYAWATDKEFLDFMAIAAYGPHASTHGVIGSVYGCDLMDPLLADGIIRDAESQLSICKKWGFYLKELYRANYILPRTDDCSAGELTKDTIDCGFTCNADTYDSLITELPSVISSQYVPEQMDEAAWSKWRDFVCEGDAFRVFVGDHLESGSPADPSFWPIHPTQERLLQAKLIGGGFDSTYWPSDARAEYVCDKSQCYESDYGSKDYYAECCYGHYENDQLLDFESGDKSKGIGPTNGQTMADTNPLSPEYAMPYVYQHFMWTHCEDEDFEKMFTTSSTTDNENLAGVVVNPRSSTKEKKSSSKKSSSKKSSSKKSSSKKSDYKL